MTRDAAEPGLPPPSIAPRPPAGAAPAGGAAAFRDRAVRAGVGVGALTDAPLRRRVATASGDGDIAVDLYTYAADLDGRAVELSPRQVELLALFLAEPQRVWSREQLHWICWQDSTPSRRVDVQLCRIRTKVGLDLFRNIRDRGWSLRHGGEAGRFPAR